LLPDSNSYSDYQPVRDPEINLQKRRAIQFQIEKARANLILGRETYLVADPDTK
jgi:hypothetical protein